MVEVLVVVVVFCDGDGDGGLTVVNETPPPAPSRKGFQATFSHFRRAVSHLRRSDFGTLSTPRSTPSLFHPPILKTSGR